MPFSSHDGFGHCTSSPTVLELSPMPLHEFRLPTATQRGIPDPPLPSFRTPESLAAGFDYHVYRVEQLLESHQMDSAELQTAFEELRRTFPQPPTELVGSEIWGTAEASIRVNSHLKSDLSEAIANIQNTGRQITADDEQWLKLLLSHWSGWSATDPEHFHDPWVRFIQALFGHIEGLVPVLDSLTWPTELKQFPVGFTPIEPSFFLLATLEYFYLFDLDGLGFYRAGRSLEEVYQGIKECRFAGGKEGDWKPEEWCDLDLDDRDYFPVYGHVRNIDGSFNLQRPLQQYPVKHTQPEDHTRLQVQVE
jgi:hypothetical protein